MTLSESDRQKFEHLKEQAELKAQWADAMLKGDPWPRQLYAVSEWIDLPEAAMHWAENMIYRRKPKPTTESPLALAGHTFVNTFLSDGADGVEIEVSARGQRFKITAQPIAAPEPTLAERNAQVRAEWEAMEETADKSIRLRAGAKCRVQWRNLTHEGSEWFDNDMYFQRNEFQWSEKGPIEYRIVQLPEPSIVPYTFETCPPSGTTVARKGFKEDGLIERRGVSEISACGRLFSYAQALESLWLIPDPTKPNDRRPFGMEVSE